MAGENLERVRAGFDRWNAGDRELTDADIHPDFELSSPLSSTRGRPYRGREGFELWMRDIDEQFDRWQIEIDEFRETDDGRILAFGRIHLRGRESGIEMDQPGAWLIELREDMFYRMTVWTSRDEALSAAGLA